MSRLRPGGKPLALKVIGEVPLAVTVKRYGVPTVPFGGGPLVITVAIHAALIGALAVEHASLPGEAPLRAWGVTQKNRN